MVRFSPEELVAAYLADPLRTPPDLPWATCDVQKVVDILQQNKVPLLSITECKDNCTLFNNPLFQSARRAEAQVLAGLRTEYEKVKVALAAQDIQDVMIKSVGLAPSFPYRSDNLDVLYRVRDVQIVRATLCEIGYVELRNVEEPLKYLFRKFHAGRSVSAIHLHAHVGWMVSFLDEEALWQRCSVSADDPAVTVPAAEDALLTTLAHYFYEDKRVALLDVVKFAHCLRRGVDWDEVYRVATWRGWRDGLNVSLFFCAHMESALYGETLVPRTVRDQVVHELPRWTRKFLERRLGPGAVQSFLRAEHGQGSSTGENQVPLRIPFAFSKVFFYAKLVRDPTRSVRRRVKDVVVHTGYGTKLRLHIHSQPRLLITLSGIDGSGKTTQAHALQSAFHVCHLHANHVWSRGGSARWLQLLRLRRKSPAEAGEQLPQEQKVRLRQERFRSRWLRWGWSWLTAIELLLKYTREVTLPLLLGRVVICDRYIYDTFADWAAYFREPVHERLAARLLRLLTPTPAVRYWLDVPAELAQKRSPEQLPANFLQAQANVYRQMTAQHGLQRREGASSKDEVADQIVYEVLSRYFADYRTVVNALFLKNPGQWR